jgi:hypothetical protein
MNGELPLDQIWPIIAIVALSLGAATIVIVARSIMREMRLSREMQQDIASREFHSQYSRNREDLERQLYRINQELTDTRSEFKEIYHLVAETQSKRSSEAERDSSFKKTFGIADINEDKDHVFILTPFSKTEQSTYSTLVGFFQSHGRSVSRGDETSAPGDIFSHIIKEIASASLIIANLNGRNANVLYELGIAQALDKKVIIIAHVKEKVPFDLQSQRTILYSDKKELIDGLTSSLLAKS